MEKEKFKTGAEKEKNEKKGRFDLLPAKSILRVAKRFQFGAIKYSDNNWKKGGIPNHMFIDSCLRHIFQHQDKQTDEDHLAAAVCNLLMLMELQE